MALESIFSIEIEKIRPNPLQPREDFNEEDLEGLAESIRQYGILQPLVVIRKEEEVPYGTSVYYELIAGERRLRAARLAGLNQVPVIVRKEAPERVKLEMSLIENIQREDLNVIERAKAFKQLAEEFKMKHSEIGAKVGKSREYVTNTIRVINLPEEIQRSIIRGEMHESFSRPLLMLADRPEAQKALFQEILTKKNMKVGDAERISRHIAVERSRKRNEMPDPESRMIEEKLGQVLGARVAINRKGFGGTIAITFFSEEELRAILSKVLEKRQEASQELESPPETFSI